MKQSDFKSIFENEANRKRLTAAAMFEDIVVESCGEGIYGVHVREYTRSEGFVMDIFVCRDAYGGGYRTERYIAEIDLKLGGDLLISLFDDEYNPQKIYLMRTAKAWEEIKSSVIDADTEQHTVPVNLVAYDGCELSVEVNEDGDLLFDMWTPNTDGDREHSCIRVTPSPKVSDFADGLKGVNDSAMKGGEK